MRWAKQKTEIGNAIAHIQFRQSIYILQANVLPSSRPQNAPQRRRFRHGRHPHRPGHRFSGHVQGGARRRRVPQAQGGKPFRHRHFGPHRGLASS